MPRLGHQLIVAAVGALLVSQTHAAVLLSDNFDSYADQTAFNAKWTAGGTLSTAQAFSGTQSVNLPTTAARSVRNYTTVTPTAPDTAPTAANDLVYSFRFYDDFTAQGRQQSELLDGAGSANGQALGMGTGNSPSSSEYFWRITSIDPDGAGPLGVSNYAPLDAAAPNRSLGWHEMKIVAHFATATTETVDFFVDGVLGKTVTGVTLRNYDSVRLGSNVSSTNQAWFDDVQVETVPTPEPASLSLAAFGAIGLLQRRRRKD